MSSFRENHSTIAPTLKVKNENIKARSKGEVTLTKTLWLLFMDRVQLPQS